MAETKRSGVTADTPKRIVFDAGTIHKGLRYNTTWNFAETLVGATSGGAKFNVTPELHKIALDGANVAVKGLTKKIGEVATLEINFAELTNDVLLASTLGQKATTSTDATMDKFISKADIVEGDYWENVAIVGRTVEGKDCIVILPNALCTSGLTIDGKPKAEGVSTIVFECHSSMENPEVLPYEIYFPKAA